MGYNRAQWKFLNKCFKTTVGEGWKEKISGIKMLELGCQIMKKPLRQVLNLESSKHSAKAYFKSLGVKHVSIDITGCFKSLSYNLTRILPSKFHNRFDTITNSGTSEHIMPFYGQYNCFKNIHICAKLNAVIIHIVPALRTEYLGHCQIYYSKDFFYRLAKLNKYKIIYLEDVIKTSLVHLIGCCYIKQLDIDFTKNKKALLKKIILINKKIYKNARKNRMEYRKQNH